MLWRKEVASIQSYQFYGFRLITELKIKGLSPYDIPTCIDYNVIWCRSAKTSFS